MTQINNAECLKKQQCERQLLNVLIITVFARLFLVQLAWEDYGNYHYNRCLLNDSQKHTSTVCRCWEVSGYLEKAPRTRGWQPVTQLLLFYQFDLYLLSPFGYILPVADVHCLHLQIKLTTIFLDTINYEDANCFSLRAPPFLKLKHYFSWVLPINYDELLISN